MVEKDIYHSKVESRDRETSRYAFEDVKRMVDSGELVRVKEVQSWDDYSQDYILSVYKLLNWELIPTIDFSDPRSLEYLLLQTKPSATHELIKFISSNPSIVISPAALNYLLENNYSVLPIFKVCIDKLQFPASVDVFLLKKEAFARRELLEYIQKYLLKGGKNLIVSEELLNSADFNMSDEEKKSILHGGIPEQHPFRKELESFLQQHPDFIDSYGVRWNRGILLTSDKLPVWIDTLDRVLETYDGEIPYQLFSSSNHEVFTDKNIELCIPYLDKYNNVLDARLIRRFIQFNAKSEKEILEAERQEGFEDVISAHETENEYIAQTLTHERKRERLKNLERPLYRSIGMNGLFHLWKYGDLATTLVRGNPDTDAEPNTIITYWADVPTVLFSGAAIVETNPALWKEQPSVWKGKMRWSIRDYSQDWDNGKYRSFQMDEYYLRDTVKKDQLSSIKIDDTLQYLIPRLREEATKMLSVPLPLSELAVPLLNSMHSMFNDDFGETRPIETKAELEEIIRFCNWALELPEIDRDEVLHMKMPSLKLTKSIQEVYDS